MAAEYLARMGERIRTRREELGLSRSDVARQMPGKTNENAIYRWELGKHRPHPDAMEALAKVLDVSVAYFMSEQPDKTETPDLVSTMNGDRSSEQLERIETLLKSNQALLRDLAAGLMPDEPQSGPPWKALARRLAEMDAQDRAASPPATRRQKPSKG